MRTRTKVSLLGLTSILVAVASWLYFSKTPPEPTFHERPLSEWLQIRAESSLSKNQSAITRSNEAAVAILSIGTNGLASALAWLPYRPSEWNDKLRTIARQSPLNAGMKKGLYEMLREKERKSNYALDYFRLLTSTASSAIPALANMANQTNYGWTSIRAITCLGVIGSNSLPTMTGMLAATNSTIRPDVIRSMSTAHFRREADWSSATPLLLRYADDTDTDVSAAALAALGTIQKQPELTIPLLTTKLGASSDRVRGVAAYALGRFGTQAASAVPALILMTKDRDKSIRAAATNALTRIAPEALTNAPAQ